MPDMDKKLTRFLEGSSIEMAPGGPHRQPWSRRLIIVLLALGIFATSFSAFTKPGKAAPTQKTGKTSLQTAFQQKADAPQPSGKIMVVARKDVMDAPEALLSHIMEEASEIGVATDTAQDIIDLIHHGDSEHKRVQSYYLDATEPDANPMVMTLIVTNTQNGDAKALLSNLSDCAPGSIRATLPISLDDLNRGTMYQELGANHQLLHDTIPASGNAGYTSQMENLHKDLCLMVGLLRDTGHMEANRAFINARTLGTFGRVINRAHSGQETPQKIVETEAPYALGESLEKGFAILQNALSQPDKASLFLQASDQDIADIATTLFDEIRPSEEDYNKNVSVLQSLAMLAPGLKPTDHKGPLIASSYAFAKDQGLSGAIPMEIRTNLKSFLEQAFEASKAIQRDMTPEELKLCKPTASDYHSKHLQKVIRHRKAMRNH